MTATDPSLRLAVARLNERAWGITVGLLLGLEFTTPDASVRFARRALDAGLILSWTLHRDTVVRLAPPLVLTDHEAERATSGIRAALGA